jgi:hypothetical protein
MHKITILHAHTTSFFTAVCIKLLIPKLTIIWHNHTGANIFIKGFKLYFIQFCSFFFSTTINVNSSLLNWANSKLFNSRNELLKNFASLSNTSKVTNLKGNHKKLFV